MLLPQVVRRDWDNALWLVAAGYFIYYWEVPSTVLYDERVIR
jgi:hypothetical protein